MGPLEGFEVVEALADVDVAAADEEAETVGSMLGSCLRARFLSSIAESRCTNILSMTAMMSATQSPSYRHSPCDLEQCRCLFPNEDGRTCDSNTERVRPGNYALVNGGSG